MMVNEVSKKRVSNILISCGLIFICSGACNISDSQDKTNGQKDWPEYLGGPDRNHYSNISQINAQNVQNLKVAWEFHTGDSGQLQCNPIVIDSILYGVTASNAVFALNAKSGKQIWRLDLQHGKGTYINRGVTYWSDRNDRRLFFVFESWLYALDADSGRPIQSFGENGRISLKVGLGENAQDKFVTSTSPGTIFENLIIMPLRVSEGADAAPGHIQAFDVRSGKLIWVFHTVPHPGEYGYETWPENAYKNIDVGGANSWAGMAIDRERNLLFVPTGSAGFDFYGANRKGQNLFANSLIALDARTGQRKWHYQFVHHDIWDRDLPAPPNLTTITRDGMKIPVVAQVTKTGHVFIFHRETGVPVFPIREVPVPKHGVDGEEPWPTQPLPELPMPFTRQLISQQDLNPYSSNKDSLLSIFKSARKGVYQPLSTTPTLFFPGLDGGAEWGGAAVDRSGIMYINANEMAWLLSLNPVSKEKVFTNESPAKQLYTTYCMSCHGADKMGNQLSGYPSLLSIQDRMTPSLVADLLRSGKGMMPGFPALKSAERQSLIDYLFNTGKTEHVDSRASTKKIPYVPFRFNGYRKFLDDEGYPAISPPWGTLTAIDLNTGEKIWQVPLGEYEELKKKGIPATGTENYGGPLVTGSGLVFIAATRDGKFRAFEKQTGKMLWETILPASGFATPSTYEVNGKQFIVIACGGTKLGTRKGESYLAFSLP